MDSITQAVLGASIGEAMLGKKIGAKAAITGAIIATIPDLDVAFYFIYDSYDMLRIHRGYSHSILFTLALSFIIAYFLKSLKWGKVINFPRLWLFSWLSLFTHVVLDAFTSYGTQLLLPFSDSRLGLDSINVVDPLYTLPLLIGLFLSVYWYKNNAKKSVPNSIGLLISTLYLLATLGFKNIANDSFEQRLSSRNIAFENISTIPVGIAGVNWYGIARTSDSLYLNKLNIIKEQDTPIESFPINEELLGTLNPEVANEMRWFAKGNYTVVADASKIRIYNLQVDMRGVIKDGDKKYPTAGYFELTPSVTNETVFSSGTHKNQK